MELGNESQFLFYNGNNGKIRIQVILGDETVWATQKSLSEIFNVEVPAISKHIAKIISEGELETETTISKMEIVQQEGSRNVRREVEFYNLDMIIAVGYRVNSYQATQFRIWATKILKEYLVKGFALDDERLKQGNNLFNKDYFTELLERIREIRNSERMFYQKITDLYAESVDYDPRSPITQHFYAIVQNKLHWAIHKHTASELIRERANAKSPNMGLTTWKNYGKGGKIIKTDITVAKNYLTKEELDGLNRFVSMYLDYAENLVKRNMVFKMEDWVKRLDSFLQFNEYEILKDNGKVSHEIACKLAEKEYEKFRIVQDREYKSDFDKIVEGINTTNTIPEETTEPTSTSQIKHTFKLPNLKDLEQKIKDDELSSLNKDLKKALGDGSDKKASD